MTQLQRFYDGAAMGEGWSHNPVLVCQRALLRDIVDRKPSLRVLDLGCGHGTNTQVLFGDRDRARVTGLDVSRRAVQDYVTTTGSPAVRASGDALPFGDSTFDLVVSDDVIEHLVDTDGYAREIRRVLQSARACGRLPARVQ